MFYKKIFIYSVAIFIIALIFTILFYNYTINIERIVIYNKNNNSSNLKDKNTVYIGVISRYPPNIIYRGYQPILDYLTQNTNYNFQLKLSENYNQTIEMLINKEVEAAFVGSYVYIEAKKKFDIKPILKPLNENFLPYSRSVLFVKRISKIKSISDIKGKTIALPSAESFSANWFTNVLIKDYKIDISDLGEIKNFPHHQSVIYQVVRGNYNIGVTREYLLKNLLDSTVTILAYSNPIPTSPIIVLSNNNSKAIEEMVKSLLLINKDNKLRKEITKGWDNEFVYGFYKAEDKDYDIIRELKKEKNGF
ncbi:MAG TPA: phosphate/phosphite/phosphonate ABC transporter substrate-binding protein [Melioribacteraceae bacterium]|nr:phosphate/phosphite/phosphonate ABC transporter substrate-binding protein [Melioribacteraceae bacterium]